jgi:hypothetical protein
MAPAARQTAQSSEGIIYLVLYKVIITVYTLQLQYSYLMHKNRSNISAVLVTIVVCLVVLVVLIVQCACTTYLCSVTCMYVNDVKSSALTPPVVYFKKYYLYAVLIANSYYNIQCIAPVSCRWPVKQQRSNSSSASVQW